MDKSRSRKANHNYKRSKNKKLMKGLQTNKIVDRILYNPVKHKQKWTRKRRKELMSRPPMTRPATNERETFTLKVGSFNVNGLDIETCYSIEELVKSRQLDVGVML